MEPRREDAEVVRGRSYRGRMEPKNLDPEYVHDKNVRAYLSIYEPMECGNAPGLLADPAGWVQEAGLTVEDVERHLLNREQARFSRPWDAPKTKEDELLDLEARLWWVFLRALRRAPKPKPPAPAEPDAAMLAAIERWKKALG